MLLLHPPSDEPAHIPSMTGPEGFVPQQPIRVHLARDEDINSFDEERGLPSPNDTADPPSEIKEKPVALPPPAYGLWRSSVRVDPNLLHWQRVESAQSAPPLPTNSRATSAVSTRSAASGNSVVTDTQPVDEDDDHGPRPPSYMSDDGVSYIVEAAPRSVAPSHSGVSDIHPAWRPGYAVSEVPMEEWPRGVPRQV